MMGVQRRYHVVETGTQHAEQNGKDAHVQNIVGLDTLLLGAEEGVDKGSHDTQHDDDAIPVDRLAEKLKGDAVNGEFSDAETGEGYGSTHVCFLSDQKVSSDGSTTERVYWLSRKALRKRSVTSSRVMASKAVGRS